MPFFQDGIEITYQRVHQRSNGEFEKKNKAGEMLKSFGLFNPIGYDETELLDNDPWIVVEGFVTGLTLRMVFANQPYRFAVAGGLGRIKPIVRVLQEKYPDAEIFVGADRGIASEEAMLKCYQETGAHYAMPVVPEGEDANNWDFNDSWVHYLQKDDQGLTREQFLDEMRVSFSKSLLENARNARAAYRLVKDTADGPCPLLKFAKAVEDFLGANGLTDYEHRHFTDSPSNQKSQIILPKGYLVLELNVLTPVHTKPGSTQGLEERWRSYFVQVFGNEYLRVHAELHGVDLSGIDIYLSDDIGQILAKDDEVQVIRAGTGSGKTLTALRNVFAPLVRLRMQGEDVPQPIFFVPSKLLIRQIMVLILRYEPDIYPFVQMLTREESRKIGDSTEDKLAHLHGCMGIVTHYTYAGSRGLTDRPYPLARHILAMNTGTNPGTIHIADEIHELFGIAQVAIAQQSRYVRQPIVEDSNETSGDYTIGCRMFKTKKAHIGLERPCYRCEFFPNSTYKRMQGGAAGVPTVDFRPRDPRNLDSGRYPEIRYEPGPTVEIAALKITQPINLSYVLSNGLVNVTYLFAHEVAPFSVHDSLSQFVSVDRNPLDISISYLQYVARLQDLQVHEVYPVVRSFSEGQMLREERVFYSALADPMVNYEGCTVTANSQACEIGVFKGFDPYAFKVLGLGKRLIITSGTISDAQKRRLADLYPQANFYDVKSVQPKLKKLFVIRYAKSFDLGNEVALEELTRHIAECGGSFLLGLPTKETVERLAQIEALVYSRVLITEFGYADYAVEDDCPVAHISYMHHPTFTGTNQPKRQLIILDCQCYKPISSFFLPYSDFAWQSTHIRDALMQKIADDQEQTVIQAGSRNARWLTKEDSPEIDYENDHGHRMLCLQNVPVDRVRGGLEPPSELFMKTMEDRYEEVVIVDIQPGRNAKKEIYGDFERFFEDPTTLKITKQDKDAQKAFDRKFVRRQRLIIRATELKHEGKTKRDIYDALNLARHKLTKDELAQFWKDVGLED